MQRKNIFYVLGGVLLLIILYFLLFSAPASFPPNTVFRIEEGSSLRTISYDLKENGIIRSRVIFESFVIILGDEKRIKSFDYLFETKLPVFEVARRIALGEHHMPPVVVTVPEGFDVEQIADIFAKRLANFNKDEFLLKAKGLEGYLFPDTYFFLTGADEDTVLQSMNYNFKKKTAPLLPDFIAFGKTEKDIIVMASIIEKEAKGDLDRETISGILWKRISIGIPLQVDAAPDTYKIKGLPTSPIANPGLLAIKAAINPESSPYLYYLHDKNGIIHYAKSFAEHKENIKKYLK
jgi:UPF0755 protein